MPSAVSHFQGGSYFSLFVDQSGRQFMLVVLWASDETDMVGFLQKNASVLCRLRQKRFAVKLMPESAKIVENGNVNVNDEDLRYISIFGLVVEVLLV